MDLGLYPRVQHTSRLANCWVRPGFAEALGKIAESAHGNARHPKCGRTERWPGRRSHTAVLNLGKQCQHGAVWFCEGAHAIASLRVLAAHECDRGPCAHIS